MKLYDTKVGVFIQSVILIMIQKVGYVARFSIVVGDGVHPVLGV